MAGKNYRCPDCGAEFDSRERLEEHGRQTHPGSQRRETGREGGMQAGGRGGERIEEPGDPGATPRG